MRVFVALILAIYGTCLVGIGVLVYQNHHYHPHCGANEVVVKGEWHMVCAVGYDPA